MENLEFFWKKIKLNPNVIFRLKSLKIPEKDYKTAKELFYEDKEGFYDKTLNKKNHRLLFLYYYSKMAMDLYPEYKNKRISKKIYFDTFSDLKYWCDNCFLEFGEYGISDYRWFAKHLELKIFRLGRLQFEPIKNKIFFKKLNLESAKLNNIINVHIPQGERLEMSKVKASIKSAYQFFGKECNFICFSWLLSPVLNEILDENTNIIKFQKNFQILKIYPKDKLSEKYIFGKLEENPEKYPEKTSLQKNLKKHLLSGKHLGTAIGLLKTDFLIK